MVVSIVNDPIIYDEASLNLEKEATGVYFVEIQSNAIEVIRIIKNEKVHHEK
jgi:hypothetical protein